MGGIIPPELFDLSNLSLLQLHDSSFSGVLSEEEFGELSGLRSLWLQNNKFSGSIPIRAIEKMPNLEELNLYSNDLTGTITELVCLQRGLGGGELAILKVDCSVSCGCCDGC